MEKQQLIYEKMAQIVKEVEAVTKDGTNRTYTYPTIEAIMSSMHDALSKAQVFIMCDVVEAKITQGNVGEKGTSMRFAEVKAKYSFYTTDGSHVDSILLGEAFDAGDKAISKALTSAYKKCLTQTFCIPIDVVESDGKDGKEKENFAKRETPKTDEKKPETKSTQPNAEDVMNPFEDNALPVPNGKHHEIPENMAKFPLSDDRIFYFIIGEAGKVAPSGKAQYFTPEGKTEGLWVPLSVIGEKKTENGLWIKNWFVEKSADKIV